MNTQKKSKTNDARFIVKIGISLLLIAAVTAGLLAFVNSITKDKIAENEFRALQEIVSEVFGDYENMELHKGDFDENIVYVFDVYKNGDIAGYCIQALSSGFKDKMTIVVCADKEGNCLNVDVISISDTPGVGTKITDENYLDGYKGRNASSVAEYDTISGATISSSGLRRGVHAALSIDIFAKKQTTDINGNTPEKPDDNNQEPVAPSESTANDFKTPETTENVEKKLFHPNVDNTVAVTRRSETYTEETTTEEPVPETTTTVAGTTTGNGTTKAGETTSTIPGETTKTPAESEKNN